MSFGLKRPSQGVGKSWHGSSTHQCSPRQRKKYSGKKERKKYFHSKWYSSWKQQKRPPCSTHWFYCCSGGNRTVATMPRAEHLVPDQGRGQKHLTNMAGTKGPRAGPKPSITWSKSWAAGSICVAFAIMLHFPACRQLTEQMSLKWLNVLSCYLFNSDVENVSHSK